jgi:hypothetical protein
VQRVPATLRRHTCSPCESGPPVRWGAHRHHRSAGPICARGARPLLVVVRLWGVQIVSRVPAAGDHVIRGSTAWPMSGTGRAAPIACTTSMETTRRGPGTGSRSAQAGLVIGADAKRSPGYRDPLATCPAQSGLRGRLGWPHTGAEKNTPYIMGAFLAPGGTNSPIQPLRGTLGGRNRSYVLFTRNQTGDLSRPIGGGHTSNSDDFGFM